jgi:hypothetical protein
MLIYRLTAARWFGLGLLALVGCAPQSQVAASKSQVAPIEPGMARVWFFRQADPSGGNVYAANPIIYANGAAVGEIQQGTAFFHDFPAGKYRFTVQPFGTPLANTTPFSWCPARKPTCRSSGNPVGKRTA